MYVLLNKWFMSILAGLGPPFGFGFPLLARGLRRAVGESCGGAANSGGILLSMQVS